MSSMLLLVWFLQVLLQPNTGWFASQMKPGWAAACAASGLCPLSRDYRKAYFVAYTNLSLVVSFTSPCGLVICYCLTEVSSKREFSSLLFIFFPPTFSQSAAQARHVANLTLFTLMTFSRITCFTEKKKTHVKQADHLIYLPNCITD